MGGREGGREGSVRRQGVNDDDDEENKDSGYSCDVREMEKGETHNHGPEGQIGNGFYRDIHTHPKEKRKTSRAEQSRAEQTGNIRERSCCFRLLIFFLLIDLVLLVVVDVLLILLLQGVCCCRCLSVCRVLSASLSYPFQYSLFASFLLLFLFLLSFISSTFSSYLFDPNHRFLDASESGNGLWPPHIRSHQHRSTFLDDRGKCCEAGLCCCCCCCCCSEP